MAPCLGMRLAVFAAALGEVWAAEPEPSPDVSPSISDDCTEAETSYFVMGYSFLMKEDWRIATACGLTGMSVSTLTGVEALLDKSAFNAKVTECIKYLKSQKLMPVVARGARRGWYSHRKRVDDVVDGTRHQRWYSQALDVSSTSLGAVYDDDAEIYAVIYEISKEQLKNLDERETKGTGYPAWVSLSKLTLLKAGDELPRCAKVRWYPIRSDFVQGPTPTHPIVMSEVDLVVGGADEIAKRSGVPNFCANVVKTIYGWSPLWVNDREHPYDPWDWESRDISAVLVTVANDNGRQIPPNQPQPAMGLSRRLLQPLTINIMREIDFPANAHTRSRSRHRSRSRVTLSASSTIASIVTLLAAATVVYVWCWRLSRQRSADKEDEPSVGEGSSTSSSEE